MILRLPLDQDSARSVGLGSHLGASTDAADAALADALTAGIDAGIDLLDTAVNYRDQRSERVLGRVLGRYGAARRAALTLCTKAGFVPWDHAAPRDAAAHYRRIVVEGGLGESDTLTPEGHCLAPRYLRWSVARSLENLGAERVDVVYLHNPEAQRAIASDVEVYARIRRSIEVLEELVAEGRIGAWGVATWEAFRADSGAPEHLSLARLVSLAHEVAGAAHHFALVQAPLSLLAPEAAVRRTQTVPALGTVSLLRAVQALGLRFVASSPLGGGELRSRAAAALDFARSLPGVSRALLGVRTPQHAALAVSRAHQPRLRGDEVRALVANFDL